MSHCLNFGNYEAFCGISLRVCYIRKSCTFVVVVTRVEDNFHNSSTNSCPISKGSTYLKKNVSRANFAKNDCVTTESATANCFFVSRINPCENPKIYSIQFLNIKNTESLSWVCPSREYWWWRRCRWRYRKSGQRWRQCVALIIHQLPEHQCSVRTTGTDQAAIVKQKLCRENGTAVHFGFVVFSFWTSTWISVNKNINL